MSLSSYNPNDRYRQRAAKRFSNFMMGLFILGTVFAAGFWVNTVYEEQATYILQEEKAALREQVEELQNEATELRAEAQTANVRLEQLRVSYDELLDHGALKNLIELLKQQLDKGVAKERLTSVILSARPPQNCSTPESKRFVVKTPVYKGPVSQSSISGGDVRVFGEGVSAQNQQGQREAWYDPAQAVEISFKARDGDAIVKSGVLPIYHSVVVDDKEYRITVSNGAKSFANVTFDHCDYP